MRLNKRLYRAEPAEAYRCIVVDIRCLRRDRTPLYRGARERAPRVYPRLRELIFRLCTV